MKRITFLFGLLSMLVSGDTIKLKDGQSVSGIVRSIESGKVTVETAGQRRAIDILQVDQIDFDTPHAEETPSIADVPVREFTRDAERLIRAQTATRKSLDQIKARWSVRKSVEPGQTGQWAAEKERFSGPLADYREAIHQMYLDVAAHVDNYDKIAGEAHDLYVGVNGLLRVGSPLINEDQGERPLKEFMPGHWYDQIYYEAYKKGFNDAVEFQALTPR